MSGSLGFPYPPIVSSVGTLILPNSLKEKRDFSITQYAEGDSERGQPGKQPLLSHNKSHGAAVTKVSRLPSPFRPLRKFRVLRG